MAGRCDARPDLVDAALPLTVHLPAVPCRVEDDDLLRALFEPLGWRVRAERLPLDPTLPHWGPSRYVDLVLEGEQTVAAALSHLYVLLPVLDGSKHYWVGADEIDKLLGAAGAWLPDHPEREQITHRYLAGQRSLARTALDRLAEVDDTVPAAEEEPQDAATVPLARTRAAAVLAELRAVGARSVADLGCGEGALLDRLLDEPTITRVLGTDVSVRALERASRRVDRRAERQRERLTLVQSSLTYTDDRLTGFDAAVLMEVVEHLDPPRLGALERAVLGHARPATLVVTTPNAEHNVRYGLHDGEHRHTDHRFEWDRAAFRAWAQGAAERHGYAVRFVAVGEDDPDVGPPTQMAVLTRGEAA
jgi:3' terminal RNA ribose 2'-O-methyltransferase Hen1